MSCPCLLSRQLLALPDTGLTHLPGLLERKRMDGPPALLRAMAPGIGTLPSNCTDWGAAESMPHSLAKAVQALREDMFIARAAFGCR